MSSKFIIIFNLFKIKSALSIKSIKVIKGFPPYLLMFYKYGGKQLYYFNTFDGQGEIDLNKLDVNNKLEDITEGEEACESCVL